MSNKHRFSHLEPLCFSVHPVENGRHIQPARTYLPQACYIVVCWMSAVQQCAALMLWLVSSTLAVDAMQSTIGTSCFSLIFCSTWHIAVARRGAQEHLFPGCFGNSADRPKLACTVGTAMVALVHCGTSNTWTAPHFAR